MVNCVLHGTPSEPGKLLAQSLDQFVDKVDAHFNDRSPDGALQISIDSVTGEIKAQPGVRVTYVFTEEVEGVYHYTMMPAGSA